MKEIAARIESDDLERYRRIESRMKALESGAVNMTMQEACAISDEHRDFWIEMHEKHELDEEEFHEFDSVTGIISVLKE